VKLKFEMSSHFAESTDSRYVGFAMDPEYCPRKGWQSMSYWLHPRESDPEVSQGPELV